MSKENDRCYVVMEKCDQDVLQALIESPRQRFEERDAAHFFQQILNGLNHCHRIGIHHGDIKPENLLLKKGVLKLTDFCSNMQNVGSSVYSSPDIHERDVAVSSSDRMLASATTLRSSFSSFRLLAAADIWSAGVTLFVMCAGYTPWKRPNSNDLNYSEFISSPRNFFPSHFSENLKDILCSMLSANPIDRLTVQECLAHPWMKEYNGPMTHHSPYLEKTTAKIFDPTFDTFMVSTQKGREHFDYGENKLRLRSRSRTLAVIKVGTPVSPSSCTTPSTSCCSSPSQSPCPYFRPCSWSNSSTVSAACSTFSYSISGSNITGVSPSSTSCTSMSTSLNRIRPRSHSFSLVFSSLYSFCSQQTLQETTNGSLKRTRSKVLSS